MDPLHAPIDTDDRVSGIRLPLTRSQGTVGMFVLYDRVEWVRQRPLPIQMKGLSDSLDVTGPSGELRPASV